MYSGRRDCFIKVTNERLFYFHKGTYTVVENFCFGGIVPLCVGCIYVKLKACYHCAITNSHSEMKATTRCHENDEWPEAQLSLSHRWPNSPF